MGYATGHSEGAAVALRASYSQTFHAGSLKNLPEQLPKFRRMADRMAKLSGPFRVFDVLSELFSRLEEQSCSLRGGAN